MARAIGVGGAAICGACFLVIRYYTRVNAERGDRGMVAIGRGIALLCFVGFLLNACVALAAH